MLNDKKRGYFTAPRVAANAAKAPVLHAGNRINECLLKSVHSFLAYREVASQNGKRERRRK